jgi:hypothetical protein
MVKKEIDAETASQIKKELAELRTQLEIQKKTKKKQAKSKQAKSKQAKSKQVTPKKKPAKSKQVTPKKKPAKSKQVTPKKKPAKSKQVKPKKKLTKAQLEKAKKIAKAEREKAKKEAQAEKEKAEAEAKAKKEAAERTHEDDLEEQFSDEQIRNFQIEKMDMDKLTNKVCEIIADYEDNGMLQSDLWKKLKLNSRDGSRLALRLERRGLITREKILKKGRWTYKLIIEQAPIKLESLIDSPCLTCPVEQKCDFENAYPEPSPLHCQLIEDWVAVDFSKKKK